MCRPFWNTGTNPGSAPGTLAALCGFEPRPGTSLDIKKNKVMKKTKFAAVVYNYIYNAATSGKALKGIKSLELPCVPVKSFRDAETTNLADAAREYGRRSYGRLFGRVSIKYTVTYGNGRKYSGYLQ